MKSLGEYYDEFSLKNRMKEKKKYEAYLDKRIKELEAVKAPNLCVLQEVRHYIVTVHKGDLPMRKKNAAKPYCWSNDPEIDKLLVLNKMLNDGMDAAAIRAKAEAIETEAQNKAAELEHAENMLRQYLEIKDKIEIVFEGKKSDVFTLEQAKATVRMYPDINSSNYRRIELIIAPAQEKVQQLSAEHQAIRAELKQITDTLGIIEKATNHTFVQHLLADQLRVDASELLMNGIYSGESL